MSNFKSMMRRMRQYTADVNRNYNSRSTELSKLSDYKGSTFYDKKVAEIDKQIEDKRIALLKGAKTDLTKMIQTMRENVGKRIAKAPSEDMVNNLHLLGMLDNITPTQIKLYAQQMADCPLAMQALQQIAGKHDMKVYVPNVEEMSTAIDVIENNIAAYLEGYRGSIETSTFTVKNLYQYFQSEETYDSSVDKVDMAFWKNVVKIGVPDMVSNNDGSQKAVDVKHFFKDPDALIAYINKQTEGLEGVEYTKKVNEILDDCPGQYGAAYRYFQTTGEKVPLMEVEE